MKKLIIYDLDGTLADTLEDIARAANHMLEKMGRTPLPVREIRDFVGKGLHHFIRKCLGEEDRERVEEGSKYYRDFYGRHMLDHSRLYENANRVLDYFRERKQAVITNKPNPFAKDMLSALGVTAYFVEIVAGNDQYPKKPSPEALLRIMKREKVAPQETLFVGDSVTDIEAGRNAGVETVVLTHGFTDEEELKAASPDVLVHHFEGFLEAARRKGW